MRKRDPARIKNYRLQQYRPAWETESWAQGWLSRSSLDPNKAFCNWCQKQLVPGKSELLGHTRSATHVRRSRTVQRTCCTCKTGCLAHNAINMGNNGKGEVVVFASNRQHPNQEFLKFKTGLESHPEAVAVERGAAVAGHTNHVTEILQDAQPVAEIGFSEDMWDDSLQVETAMAVEGLASLSRNDIQITSHQPSSTQQPPSTQQQTQIVILGPPTTASNPEEMLPSTPRLKPQSHAVTKSEAVFCNKEPVSSINCANAVQHSSSSSSSFMHNYSCTPSQIQYNNISSGEHIVNGESCCKYKIHGHQWAEYLAEKIELKRLEQQRVREELKTQKLIQQYHRLKVKKLQGECRQKDNCRDPS